MKTSRTIPCSHVSRIIGSWMAAAVLGGTAVSAQELIYQEGFNDDGEAATPKRYTMTGRAAYEVPRIQSELNNFDQKGPLFWEHNFNVTYVGNPSVPARRMTLTWRPAADGSTATEDLWKLIDSSVKWLLNNKSNAKVVVNPNVASIGALADRLSAAGHTLVDDDLTGVPDEKDVEGDLMIHGPGASNPSRFVLSPKPVIVLNNPDLDDMLVGSIGSAATFAPGKVTISAAGHPAAGGKTGTFDAFTGDQAFELVGSFLPTNSTTLATVTRIVPPSIERLGDVDASIAGNKSTENSTGTVTELDFNDGSAGNWQVDNAIPGGYAGNWGIQATGQLKVARAGTFRVAVGSDDGARLRIDLDKNGISVADTVIDDAGPHGHQVVYANVTFAAAGNYPFQLIGYNSAGGGSLEVSVATQEGAIADDALDSGFWEVLSTTGTSPVTLLAASEIKAFKAVGPNVEVQTPLIVLLNGPTDQPPGTFYDGGPFVGFEGRGFIGASGLNKWPYPDGQGYRSVQLRPVNVAGKTKVKLTVALAATVVDFETSDFITILAYPKGLSSTPITLADFAGVVNAAQPWLADKKENNVRRLTRTFADFTFDIPADATDLVVEFRVATTWWTEIAAIDNVRITSGDAVANEPIKISSATRSGSDVSVSWTGGTAPYVVQMKPSLVGPWIDVLSTSDKSAKLPMVGGTGFIRVASGINKTVQLFKTTLSGANERPNPVVTDASGAGLLALEGNKATYYVSYSNLSGPATAAHLHGPGTAEQAVGVLFNLVPAGAFGAGGILAGEQTLTDAQKTALVEGKSYINIHTSKNGGGELRGQMLP